MTEHMETFIKVQIMMAYMDEKKIEQKLKITNDDFSVTYNPTWNWELYEYRVKED